MPIPFDSESPGRPSSATLRSIVGWCLVLVACLAAIYYLALQPGPERPIIPPPPQPLNSSRELERSKFFDEEVQPEVRATDLANREAAQRCVQQIREMFSKSRAGIEPFAEDLTSIGTRFGVLRRMPTDWWYTQTDVKQFVADKFEMHLFSEESLQQGLEVALTTFREEVVANQNALLSRARAAISRTDLSDSLPIDYRDFAQDITVDQQDFVGNWAHDSVTQLVLTEMAAGTAGAVATKLVVAIGTRLAAMAATSGMAAGGTMGGGVVGGSAGGAPAGPVGVAVGAGVGLVIGVAVDWWMSARFEEKLTAEMQVMVDEVETSVLVGTNQQPGLEQALTNSCDVLREAYRQTLYESIVQGEVQ